MITRCTEQLKDKSISQKEKYRLRNNISSNKNYILRKREPQFLLDLIDQKNTLFEDLFEKFKENLSDDQFKVLMDKWDKVYNNESDVVKWFKDE